jgi:hypothetical protein
MFFFQIYGTIFIHYCIYSAACNCKFVPPTGMYDPKQCLGSVYYRKYRHVLQEYTSEEKIGKMWLH